MSLLMRALGWAIIAAVLVGVMWLGASSPAPPAKAPQRPVAPLTGGEWLLLPFQCLAGLAGLCWCLAGLLAFLSPVLVLAWLVLR